MKKIKNIKILEKYIYKKNINIIAPDVNYIKKNSKNISKSDLNILVNFHIDEIEKIHFLLNSNFMLFHQTATENDNVLPKKLCVDDNFFNKLKKFKCKQIVSLGAKFYNKENELIKFLQIFKNISIVELNKIYSYEKKLKFLPNSLLITILQVLEYKPKKIKLIGFNLHAIPSNISNKKHYDKIYDKKFFSSIFVTSDMHDYLKTTIFLRKLNKNKKIIVDDRLKTILNFKVSEKKIYLKLINHNDVVKFINKLKNIKSLDELIKYDLDLSKRIINSIDNTNLINKLNTFNKLDKIINVTYNKNINYFKTNLNINFFNLEKLFNRKFKKIVKPIILNRSIIKNIFKKVNYWDEIFNYHLFIEKKLIIFRLKFNITVKSKGIILRIFKNNKDYLEIPILKGNHQDDYLLYNSYGEIKFDIIHPPLSNNSIWKVNSFEIQYVVC